MAVTAFFAVLCSISFAPSAYAVEGEGEIVNKAGEEALVKNKFTGTGGSTTLEGVGGAKATCTSTTDVGTIFNTSEGEQTVTFKGCETAGVKCNSEGGAAGEIKITLTIVITTIKATDKALLAFTVSKSAYPEGIFSFKCGFLTTRLRGAFLIPIGEAQEHLLKTKDNFKAEQSAGLQKPTSYEDEKSKSIKDTLELETPTGKKFEQAGLTSAEEVTFEEEAEILGFERFEYVNGSNGQVVNKKITTEGGTSTLRSAGILVECRKNEGKGEVQGQSRLKKVVITYEGCEETINKCAVKSTGAAAGTVVTNNLVGELGEIESTIDDAGLDLQPESGSTLMSMETTGAGCSVTLSIAVKGDVLGLVEPENKLQEKNEAVFKASGAKQDWKHIYEEGSGGTSDGGDELTINNAETGLTSREVLTFEEQVKVLTR
jgi:hypothetical protein